MALKCKLLTVVISVDSPLPLSDTESIPLRLISAVIAPEESSGHSPSDRAFEQSSACGAAGSRGAAARAVVVQPCWHSSLAQSATKCCQLDLVLGLYCSVLVSVVAGGVKQQRGCC